MKNSIKNKAPILATVTAALLLSMNCQAAGYLKIGDIKGESKASEPAETQMVQKAGKEKPQGLLLPAVQKVRADAPKEPRKEPKK